MPAWRTTIKFKDIVENLRKTNLHDGSRIYESSRHGVVKVMLA